MSRFTKYLQFSRDTVEKIRERDQTCLFCKEGYHMHCTSPMLYEIKDIMHYLPKSAGGLGIEQNGVLGCRYHHGLLDNGNKGLGAEMKGRIKQYLQTLYPEWCETELVYQKYNF